MQTLIRNTSKFDKQNTCVPLAIVQSISSPDGAVLVSRSLPRRFQLYRDWHGTRSNIDRVVRTQTKRLLMMTSVLAGSSVTILIAVLSIQLLLVIVAGDADVEVVDSDVEIDGDGLTPEDVRFATLRCQNDSTDDAALRLQWTMRMFPDNHETHCYIKCLLGKLGLINLKNRGLDGQKLIQPLENQDIDVSEECFTHLDENLSGTCESYYRKWMDLRTSCRDFFYISLFEDPREVDKYNNRNMTQSKKLGETASEFCSKGLGDSESKELTSDQFKTGDDILSIFKCEMGCVFQHIRYFDIYGRIDKNEIIRSFREANSDSKINLKIVSKCVHRSNSLFPFGACQMAYELYQCFMKKVKNFKEIYAQRDKISRYF